MDEFDYVIVGAGSAGCAMAARLTEDAFAELKAPPLRIAALDLPVPLEEHPWDMDEVRPHGLGRPAYRPPPHSCEVGAEDSVSIFHGRLVDGTVQNAIGT